METLNRFQILEDNDLEDIESINRKYQRNVRFKTVAKKLLKKCKKCNFKKRNCTLDPLTCKAAHRTCWTCGKYGHNPQSQNCKANNRHQKFWSLSN